MKPFLFLTLLLIGIGATRAIAEETKPILSVVTNSESFYDKGQYPEDKIIWKAPLLRIQTNLTPFISYWARHCQEIHGIKGTNPERLYFSKMIIPEVVTKNTPSITEEYFKEINYAVDGSNLCYPANKGVPFKELTDSIEEVTPLPYHGKLCVISDITKDNMVIGYRILILDEKTGKELQYFTVIHDPAKNNDPWGDLQWINDRYIMQIFSGRRGTSVSLIDLKKQIITHGIESDSKELISGFVQNGNVMLLYEDGLKKYPLKQ